MTYIMRALQGLLLNFIIVDFTKRTGKRTGKRTLLLFHSVFQTFNSIYIKYKSRSKKHRWLKWFQVGWFNYKNNYKNIRILYLMTYNTHIHLSCGNPWLLGRDRPHYALAGVSNRL